MDKKEALKIVKNYKWGWELENLPNKFKKDKELVLLAVNQNWNSYKFADNNLQKDKDVLSVLENNEEYIKEENVKKIHSNIKHFLGELIEYHKDYHIKPVLDKDLTILPEVEEFVKELEIPDEKIWCMPAGDDIPALQESYPIVMNFVRDRGWRFTGRSHIMAFGTERCV